MSMLRKPLLRGSFPATRAALVVALLLSGGAACAAPKDPDIPSPAVQAARREAQSGDFAAARRSLSAILASDAARPQDREDAGAELAHIEWRIDGRPDAARTRLLALIPAAVRKVDPLLLLSRMERTLGNFDAGRSAARQALARAERREDRENAATSLAKALVEESVLASREGKAEAFGDASRARLGEGLDLVKTLVHEGPGLLAPSEVLLDAALLLDDGPAALEAWRSYFTAAGTADSGLLAAARSALTELLPRWRGPAASRGDREALVRALLESRFFTEAVIVAKDPRAPDKDRVTDLPWVRDLVAYEACIRDLRDTTDLYYRDVARGKGDANAWGKALTSRTEALWKSLSWPDGAPRFDRKLLDGRPDNLLAERFGTLIASGKTGGVPNLHMGHRVVDERRTAEQYGRRAEIRFIALDAMVSNGYETWRWDGRGAHGGWGSTGLIVQVRPAYAEGALRDWLELTDAGARSRADARLAEESLRDVERAAKDPYAWLPGLALRLRRQGQLAILEALRAKGLSGAALRAAFVGEADRAVIESSIFAHEGRHAIDAQFEKIGDGATLEYRAKLSEIAFAPVPRLAFGGIIDESIGNATPHGQANLKLMKGLVSFMDTHRAGLSRLDPSQPLLCQLDLLTDDQLRAAARSLDPMAAVAAAR
ncbi:MAG: hypothetical protein ABI584_15245 [Acidobacteriota bacterium]